MGQSYGGGAKEVRYQGAGSDSTYYWFDPVRHHDDGLEATAVLGNGRKIEADGWVYGRAGVEQVRWLRVSYAVSTTASPSARISACISASVSASIADSVAVSAAASVAVAFVVGDGDGDGDGVRRTRGGGDTPRVVLVYSRTPDLTWRGA